MRLSGRKTANGDVWKTLKHSFLGMGQGIAMPVFTFSAILLEFSLYSDIIWMVKASYGALKLSLCLEEPMGLAQSISQSRSLI